MPLLKHYGVEEYCYTDLSRAFLIHGEEQYGGKLPGLRTALFDVSRPLEGQGIAAGELKHGPLALIDKNTIVIVINPSDSTFEDTISNAHEIKARGAFVIGISDKENDLYDHFIKIPKVKESLFPLIEVIPLQILAYYLALKKNVDPDYPRNLAKSVTVK